MEAVLREGLLEGVTVAAAGTGAPVGRLRALGARVEPLAVTAGEDGEAVVARLPADADVLVWAAGTNDRAQALDAVWLAVRAVATSAWIGRRPGLAILVAPPPGGPEAQAARAGLENVARTLSIEWARHGIRTVAVLPAAATPPGELAELVSYLASPAGAYFSGCAFTLA